MLSKFIENHIKTKWKRKLNKNIKYLKAIFNSYLGYYKAGSDFMWNFGDFLCYNKN